jgi:two-component system, NtrC family, response regulator HydG
MSEKIRILIVDDDIGTAETLGDILEASGYAVELAADGPEALRRFGANPFDVVFLDIKMPGMDGVEVFRRMKRQGQVSAVMMTAYALPDLIAEAVREGVVAVLAKPLPVERVLHFLAALRPGRPILIVEDDVALAESLQDLLRSHGHSVTCAGSGAAALAEMRRQQPDVVLLDIKLPNSNGYEILQTIRAQYPSTAVIMMTGYGRELKGLVDKSLEAGAVECLDKPFDIAQALRAIANARVQRAAERLREPERNVQ